MLFKESIPSKFVPGSATQFVPGRTGNNGNNNNNSSSSSTEDSILQPPAEIITFWTRLVENPETLTDEDRLKALSRHPLPETNALCEEKCGLTLDALIDKAIDSPEALSQQECQILRSGYSFRDTKGRWDAPSNIIRWPRDLKLLRLGAMANALTPRDRVAESRAVKRVEAINEAVFQARGKLDASVDVMNIRNANKLPWVEGILERVKDAGKVEWGFVVFRTDFGDEKAWKRFTEQIEDAVNTAVWLAKMPERLQGKWKIVWVEEESLKGANVEKLCENFRVLCDKEGDDALSPGISRDAFLYVDAQAIRSAKESLPKAGWIWAVDASISEERLASYRHDFKGSVKVSLIHVLTTFYARLDPKADPSKVKDLTQAWDVVYLKAMLNKSDGIYPPTASLN